ncbi:hypothetical protein JCM21738_1102 [Mesobacillus boroniphilus JCM 21738]|uniref:Alcohol dehydrogenase n=2 Tax=Mesobacillus boroniphilus TaxID=308892 RepID=W4RJS8_9BACI|nr:hypothetical protein JCM21738_1102 [Mesobacillus boroniphilus JCM 21738]
MVPDLFKGLGAKRVVLFGDRGLVKAGVVDKVAQIFELTSKGTGLNLQGFMSTLPRMQKAGGE